MPHNHSKKHQQEHHPHHSGEHVHPAPHKGHVHDDSTGGKNTGSPSHAHPEGDLNATHGRD